MKGTIRKKLLPQLIASLLFSGLAYADEVTVLDKISVTANKMEENLEDVPQSITVMDAEELQAKSIKTIPDLIEHIPNMKLSSTGGFGDNKVSFRGLTQSFISNNSPVVLYVDGIPMTSNRYGYDASLANVERVEVLRGPQGTLYGRDSLGAVINVITKKPENEWQGQVGGEIGSENRRFVTLNASGALKEDLLYFGINGQRNQEDAWIDNNFPNLKGDADESTDSKMGAFLLFTPTDRLSARLNVTHDKLENNWTNSQQLNFGAYSSLRDFDRDTAKNTSYDVPYNEDVTTSTQSLKVDYDAGPFTVTATTFHKDFKVEGLYDVDYSDTPANAGLTQFGYIDSETWSQEIRLVSNNDEGMRWIAGLYYENEDNAVGPYGYQSFNPFNVPGFPIGYYDYSSQAKSDNTNKAVFGQVMVPFASDFELTLGLRAQRYTTKMDNSVFGTYAASAGGLASGAPFIVNSYDGKESWNKLLPKVALRYDINDNYNVYASYSKGFMPGGFNDFAFAGGADVNGYDPQTSDNFEVGIKGGFDNLTFAANIFYLDISDIHVYRTVGNASITDNADSAHSKGVEFEVDWQATNNLAISGSVGLISAEYDDYDNGMTDFSGQKVVETPSHTATLSIAYESPLNWYTRADLRHIGKTYYFDSANSDNLSEDDYTIIDAKLGYRLNDVDLYLFALNITDEEYINGFVSSTSLGGVANFGAPRTVGAGVLYHF